MAVRTFDGKNYWALILGGSSGIGLATAEKLASDGMNIFIVHRDRGSRNEALKDIFENIRSRNGVAVTSFNTNALDGASRNTTVNAIKTAMEGSGKIRTMVHSVAKGNLKLLVPGIKKEITETAGIPDGFMNALELLSSRPADEEFFLGEEDFRLTIHAMATSIWEWADDLRKNGLFAADARVIGLTSEGNQKAWRYYAAVSAAKATLESLCRSMALELAPYGIRTNVVQSGVVDTPSLRMIPGSDQLLASALVRNPFGRLTRPADIAGVISLLSTDEASWINGAIIRADGGEALS